MNMEEDQDIQEIFEEIDLGTPEKRNNFLKFDYQQTDYSKFLKLATVTSKQQ